MGSVRLTLCTGLLAAVAFAPAAHATTSDAGVTVTPSSPAPGTDVTLRVSGCSGPTGTAVSVAFVADARLTGTDGTLTGETRIRTSLQTGSYDVQVTCAGDMVNGRITVAEKASSRAHPTQSSHGQPAAPASPVAPVHAGGGGTADLASVDARAAAPGTAQAVTGLVLAGGAAFAVGLLGARRSRGTR
ncbi:hypothetical protein [Streptomyces sp. NPDC051636]|uniref:hypothetical protein n=1 Tax=Streptomyces sp. NPDC051636 TaxID=3365663 RepID=UPI0037A0ED14